jgi:hypothetical protein
MIQLEHLQPGDWDTARRNFERLRDTLDTGGTAARIRWGIQPMTFSAATLSAAETVTHGLGRTPALVLMTAKDAPASNKIMTLYTTIYSDTTFACQGTIDAAHTGDLDACWVAIG